MKRNQSVKKRMNKHILFMLLLCSSVSIVFPSCIEKLTNQNDQTTDGIPKTAKGFSRYTVPESMDVGVPENFTFEIAESDTIFSNKSQSGNDNLIVKDTILFISSKMEVKLESYSEKSFSIKSSNSSPRQAIEHGTGPTTWSWRVTALKSGTHKLEFIISRILWDSTSHSEINKDYPIEEIEVDVNVKPEKLDTSKAVDEKDSNHKGFLWLISIPILLLGLIIWFVLKKKKQEEEYLIPLEEFNEFQSDFQQLIASDHIEKAFTSLGKFVKKHKDKKLKKTLILLKSNYQNNISRNNSNLIDNDEYNLNRSKVINELIAMTDRLKVEEP